MSDSSENPVQNKVIKAYVDSSITAATEYLASEAYVDGAITAATQNFVTSGDVETQITGKGYATEGCLQFRPWGQRQPCLQIRGL